MRGSAARAVMARETLRAARTARTEAEFYALPDRAGLLVDCGPVRTGLSGPAAGGPAGTRTAVAPREWWTARNYAGTAARLRATTPGTVKQSSPSRDCGTRPASPSITSALPRGAIRFGRYIRGGPHRWRAPHGRGDPA